MTAPIGCAKRAVGTMLAMRKPIDRMLQVLISKRDRKAEQWNMNSDRIVALAGQHHQGQRGRGEQQLDEHVGSEDRLRAQRSGAEPFKNAALAVDRNDGDQRQHGADGDQNRGQYG